MNNNLFNLPSSQATTTTPTNGKLVPLRYANLETDVAGNGEYVNLFDFGLSLNPKNAYAQVVNGILAKCQTEEELILVMTYFLQKTRVKSVVDPSQKKDVSMDQDAIFAHILASMQKP